MSKRECLLCGHDPACGFASISDSEGIYWYCHDDDHSCYTAIETTTSAWPDMGDRESDQ